MLFSAIYQQGAGLHSGAALFKKPVKIYRNTFETTSINYISLNAIYSWIRDTWEHEISHYIYAAGGWFLLCMIVI